MKSYLDPGKLHHAYFIYDCTLGNPNGDPDRNNLPRQDDETGHGLVSSGCIKRKIRNFVDVYGTSVEYDKERYKILIQENTIINEQIERAYSNQDLTLPEYQVNKKGKATKVKVSTIDQQIQVQRWIVDNYWDVRMFGAVLSTGVKAGTVCGPVQVSMSKSFNPIHPVMSSITRCASTNKEAKKNVSEIEAEKAVLDENGNLINKETKEVIPTKDNKTMGTKAYLSYALYGCQIFYSPLKDKYKKVTVEDLHLLWESLIHMWDIDRSDARGFMSPRGLWIFSHQLSYGNYPAHKLFDMIQVKSQINNPRSFSDYQIIDNSSEAVQHGVDVYCYHENCYNHKDCA